MRVTRHGMVSLCVVYMYLAQVRAGHMQWVVAAAVIWSDLIMSGNIGLNPGQVTLVLIVHCVGDASIGTSQPSVSLLAGLWGGSPARFNICTVWQGVVLSCLR